MKNFSRRVFTRLLSFRSSRMSGIQYTANISPGFLFNEAGDLLSRYRAARRAGFQFVECGGFYDYKVEELQAVLEETKLKQVLVNSFAGPNPGDLGTLIMDIPEEEFQEGMRRSINYAKSMSASYLHCLAGKLPPGKKRVDLIPLYFKRLKWVVQECLPRHLTVVIEPIGPFVSEDYFLNNYGLAVDAIAEVDCRNLKILLDVFHFQQLHPTYDVVKWARSHRKSVGHIQIAQSPKRNEPHLPGEIDYAKVLPALAELFPEKYFGLEYKPTLPTEEGLAAAKAVRTYGDVFDYTAPCS